MIVIADARVLVAELLRRRGRDLLRHPELSIVVAEDQWMETAHELARRLDILQARTGLTHERRGQLEREIRDLVSEKGCGGRSAVRDRAAPRAAGRTGLAGPDRLR